MRKDFGPQSWLFPMPVLMVGTYDDDGTPDLMNAAWGGIHDTNQMGLCLSAEHKTTANLLKRGAFTVSMATASTVVPCDYAGLVSANDVPDKVARAGLHAVKSEHVDAPLFKELPMALECRVISYDPASGALVGDIVNVCADEAVLDAQGMIDPEKLMPVTFDSVNSTYRTLGPVVGTAFSDGAAIQ